MLTLTNFKNRQTGNVAQILKDTTIVRVVQYYEEFSDGLIVICTYNHADCDYVAKVINPDEYDSELFKEEQFSCLDDALSAIEDWAEVNNRKIYFDTLGH